MKLASSIVSLLHRICWLQIAVQMAQTASLSLRQHDRRVKHHRQWRSSLPPALPQVLSYQSEGPLGWPCCFAGLVTKNECWQTACNVSVLRAFNIRWEWRHYLWTLQLGSCLHGWETVENQQLHFLGIGSKMTSCGHVIIKKNNFTITIQHPS